MRTYRPLTKGLVQDNMLNLPLRLKLFRVSAGLKQREVANAFGLTVNFVSMIERGKREPTLKYLKQFAKLVKISASVLLWDPNEFATQAAEIMDLHSQVAALIAEYAASLGIGR